MMRLIFLRHGQSEGNIKGIFLGHTDLGLTPLGARQAELAAKYLSGLKIDKIISSDLVRAYETALPAARALGLPVERDPRFREIFAGDWECVPFDELPVRYPESYATWMKNIGLARCDGGESVAELCERVGRAVDDVAENNPGKTVLIATHATPVRTQCLRAAGLPPESMADIPWVSNASVTTMEWERGALRAVETSRDDYLGENATSLPTNV